MQKLSCQRRCFSYFTYFLISREVPFHSESADWEVLSAESPHQAYKARPYGWTSFPKNRDKALARLRAKLYEQRRNAIESAYSQSRKEQVGSGDRSERIRTYNFPQGRVTDHRINLTLYEIDKVMEGAGLDSFTSALIEEDKLAKLAAFENE